MLFFLAFFCFFHSLRQYDNFTIIKFSYLVGIFVVSGLLFGAILYQYEKGFQGVDFKTYDHFVWSLWVYGSISCSAFFVLNEYLSDNKDYKQTVLILEKHEASRRSVHHIVVKIEGDERDINLPKNEYLEISMAKAVEIKLKNGFFDFLLIEKVELKY
ncbi:hypothetical protein SAMN06265349_104242 [Flavobacterium resistens]|uniref:Uncharacterized protein n=1 Tax=Flavobacterium resistens TaxID=443612 RepID=A0A521E8E4_9FLAO|nr:hypothetical protein [Flavobacterium resistens]MRX69073.1 hypothetical protein [Flavobacterium resistens]SMO80226.1 hypothetical protein SAMN06265349_104242 [Flavobacterium resistens]